MEPTHEDDERLVRTMARGDRVALGTLYDRHADVVLAVATRVLGDRREAEDLLHDVFLEAYRQAASYDPERGTVRAWLLVKVRSRALDRRKSAAVARVVAIEPESVLDARAEGEDDPSLSPDRARVLRLLASLPEEQRTVVELGYFEGLSSSEIAARLAVPIGTVKSRVAAAMGKLRAGLADGGRR